MTEQEMWNEIGALKQKIYDSKHERAEDIFTRDLLDGTVFFLIMFFHLNGWLEARIIVGWEQWLYIIPFFGVIFMAFLGICYKRGQNESRLTS